MVREMDLSEVLQAMHALYKADALKAVRDQSFIKLLHQYLAGQFNSRLSPSARKKGVTIRQEVTLYGSHKPKDVDVAVVDPDNGPLIIVGVRSQMSSIGKNALNYYEGIVGECISLQDRFPLSVIGYVYLMPLKAIKEGREGETIDHERFSRLYRSIQGRSGIDFKNIRGVYDHFAYMIVDFDETPPAIRDDLVRAAVPDVDLRVGTFVDRMVETFKDRVLQVPLFA